jgi:hypothetical protein
MIKYLVPETDCYYIHRVLSPCMNMYRTLTITFPASIEPKSSKANKEMSFCDVQDYIAAAGGHSLPGHSRNPA